MNVGLLDALIRAVIGWVLIHLPILLKTKKSEPLKIVLLIIGVILIITAITRYCGIYKIFNISTL